MTNACHISRLAGLRLLNKTLDIIQLLAKRKEFKFISPKTGGSQALYFSAKG